MSPLADWNAAVPTTRSRALGSARRNDDIALADSDASDRYFRDDAAY